jgi:hypothetical protein
MGTKRAKVGHLATLAPSNVLYPAIAGYSWQYPAIAGYTARYGQNHAPAGLDLLKLGRKVGPPRGVKSAKVAATPYVYYPRVLWTQDTARPREHARCMVRVCI